jgi:hypothetical protein
MATKTPALNNSGDTDLELIAPGMVRRTLVLLLGIISLLGCSLWYVGIPTGLIAIVMGSQDVKLSGQRIARATLILGILGVVASLLIYSLAICFLVLDIYYF